MKSFIQSIARFASRNAVRICVALLVFVLGGISAHATGDPNEALVDGAVTALTTTFAGVFVLGLGVVIAMIAKKYLRKAS